MAENRKIGFYEKYVKVPQDICISLIAFVVLSPVMLMIAAFVRIKLGRPVLFKQERAGKNGNPFLMYKFRSMSDERDSDGNLLPDKYRLNNFGKMLRSSSLDELPSLLNVIRAECSLVGPRSLLLSYNERYNSRQARRLEVRPGITGLAQINGRNAISWEKRFEYDVEYVDNITFIGDWKVIFKTVWKVLKRDGITSATSVTMEEFKGNDSENIKNE